jgi:hypothetical protein
MRKLAPLLALAAGLAECGKAPSQGPCGIAAIAGATMLLQEFGVPRQTLGSPPANLPPKLVARVAAGPALPAIVGRANDSTWLIGLDQPLPSRIRAGFGVLVLDPQGRARGVMVYESEPIRGAPLIGKLATDSIMVPLLGIQVDPTRFEDPGCPLFPDSLLR